MTSVMQQARERVVNRTAGLGGAEEDNAKGLMVGAVCEGREILSGFGEIFKGLSS